MTLSSPSSPERRSPKYALRKANREAMELIRQSPSTVTDSTPPHQNTRSRRMKAAQVAPTASPLEPVDSAPSKQRVFSPLSKAVLGDTQTKTKIPTSPDTPPGRKTKRKPECSRVRKANTEIENEKENDAVAAETADAADVESPREPSTTSFTESVPPTPGLNTALIQSPHVDFVSRAERRKTFHQDGRGKPDQKACANDSPDDDDDDDDARVDPQPRFGVGTFESTNIKSAAPPNASSYAKPPRWTLRQLSPIRKVADAEVKNETTSSFNENASYRVEDAAVQVSLCQKCNSHTAWSEMKPIVMVFTLLMLSLLYRGLLRVDPRNSSDFDSALGLAAQGTFLASFSLEDYLGDIFAV